MTLLETTYHYAVDERDIATDRPNRVTEGLLCLLLRGRWAVRENRGVSSRPFIDLRCLHPHGKLQI